ncbi:MAG: hypothetical protein JXA89_17570 [Anaerolineae bacterium]|nr:hypothetical protein [Anaerolineae bacterium]
MNTLYLVEMPPLAGQDMPLRARRILDQVSMVVSLPQDVQTAQSRLDGYGIPFKSVEPYNQESILAALQTGDIALLAHTSGKIEALVQSLIEHDIPIVPIPGPVDPITALIVSGLPAERFTFLGSVPTSRSELIAAWQSIKNEPYTIVCDALIENQKEIFDTLQTVLGKRRITLYQAGLIWRGNTSQSPTGLGEMTNTITLVIEGAVQQAEVWSEEKVRRAIKIKLAKGASPREIAHEIATRSGWKKRQIYALVTTSKAGSRPENKDR